LLRRLPLPGLPGAFHSLVFLGLVLVEKRDWPTQHRGLQLQARIHLGVDGAEDRHLEAGPDHRIAVASAWPLALLLTSMSLFSPD